MAFVFRLSSFVRDLPQRLKPKTLSAFRRSKDLLHPLSDTVNPKRYKALPSKSEYSNFEHRNRIRSRKGRDKRRGLEIENNLLNYLNRLWRYQTGSAWLSLGSGKKRSTRISNAETKVRAAVHIKRSVPVAKLHEEHCRNATTADGSHALGGIEEAVV